MFFTVKKSYKLQYSPFFQYPQGSVSSMDGGDFDIIMSFSNVYFQAPEVTGVPGTFSLKKIKGTYSIEWKPTVDLADLGKTNKSKTVEASFDHISEIIRRDLSFTEVALRLVMTDALRLPRFSFTHFPQLQVTHLLEYLTHHGIIKRRDDSSDCYRVDHESDKTETDIFDYTPTSKLDVDIAGKIAAHNSILQEDLKCGSFVAEPTPVSFQEITTLPFENARKEVCQRGLSEDARPWFWAKLLKLTPDSDDPEVIASFQKDRCEQYSRIQEQFRALTPYQKEHGKGVQDIFKVIDYDVKRNDRNLSEFADDDSPNLALLRNVLISYAMFNKDTGFVQGMGDLTSPLILVFIKSWQDDEHALFFDGTVKTFFEAEVYIFWAFVELMKVTHHERMFTDLNGHQKFVCQRITAITNAVHPLLEELVNSTELQDLPFMFRPLLLLFKRDFKTSDLLRLWDSMLTYAHPYVFPRFVGAALLILIYPKFLMHTNGTLGSAMTTLEASMERQDVWTVLQLTSRLLARMDKRDNQLNRFVTEEVPDFDEWRSFRSKYFPLL